MTNKQSKCKVNTTLNKGYIMINKYNAYITGINYNVSNKATIADKVSNYLFAIASGISLYAIVYAITTI